jgi:F-type H+-transporting ATPase subunit epsilon
MPNFKCIVVTPETTVLDEEVEFVALPLYDGELGIAPKHAPMIGRLGYGEMRVRAAGKETRYYVDGGFVQVVGDVTSVLTNRCLLAQKVDAAAAKLLLDTAMQKKANTNELFAIRERLIGQARAQVRVAQKAR